MSIEYKKNKPLFTEKEGQYLAFIHYYTKVNGIPPAQVDFQRYFRVSPPSVHQMILRLELKNLIRRIPNTPRSLTVSLPENNIPLLI
jgi:Mn-dependent DtxR family transcriptional regulator